MEIKQKYSWAVYKKKKKKNKIRLEAAPPCRAAWAQVCVRLKAVGIQRKGDTRVSKQRLLGGNWSRAAILLGTQPPQYFHRDGSTPGCLVGCREARGGETWTEETEA